jgi:hypothetical protein
MATPGIFSLMIMPARAPTVGVRTESPAFLMTSRTSLALALWNGKDPILKERLFGLTNSEGNHGEDVKEYYFYRQHANAFLHEVSVQVSAGGVSMPIW